MEVQLLRDYIKSLEGGWFTFTAFFLPVMCPNAAQDIAVDGAELAAKRDKIDPLEMADLDIYCSALNAPATTGVHVAQELGFINATYTRCKSAFQVAHTLTAPHRHRLIAHSISVRKTPASRTPTCPCSYCSSRHR